MTDVYNDNKNVPYNFTTKNTTRNHAEVHRGSYFLSRIRKCVYISLAKNIKKLMKITHYIASNSKRGACKEKWVYFFITAYNFSEPGYLYECCLCDSNDVESELHVLVQCSFYQDIRSELYEHCNLIDGNFKNLSPIDQLCFLLSRADVANKTARACYNIIQRRQSFIYS